MKAWSWTLDLGDPASDFCAEPAPNGCRANLGAFAGTAAATPSQGPDAGHCPCDP